MNSKFDQELLQDYMEKIILKSKERAMLIASERGLIEQVAKMINDAIYPLKNKGLKVRSGSDDVRYWLTTSEANVSAYSLEDIEVVLGFACSPAEIMGKVKLTKKEAEIMNELQKIWDHNMNYNYFYDFDKFKDLAEKLSALSHHIRSYQELNYYYGLDNFYLKENLLSKHYDLSDLSEDPHKTYSTRDLVRLRDLFG